MPNFWVSALHCNSRVPGGAIGSDHRQGHRHRSTLTAGDKASPTNAARAECAAYALDFYGLRKNGCTGSDAPETMAADLITDILHLIRAHGQRDPIEKLQIAMMHFETEERGEAEPLAKAETTPGTG